LRPNTLMMREFHRRSGAPHDLDVDPAWLTYALAMERLSQSAKRVGPMRGLSLGVRL
jgi:hypothetical protein